jgi:hypothetical protein
MSNESENKPPPIVIYGTDEQIAKVSVRLEDETVWLAQQQLVDLYSTSRTNVTMHIRNIFADSELREYIIKGFTMDDDRLKELGSGGYWQELLERIRDIRVSEKVFYRQILDIYATSIDYDPSADESLAFFKKV